MLRFLSRLGVARGFMGNSRLWTAVGSVALGIRVLQRLAGKGDETAYSEELKPGDCLVITHDREARIVRAP